MNSHNQVIKTSIRFLVVFSIIFLGIGGILILGGLPRLHNRRIKHPKAVRMMTPILGEV
jgi:hypothetical protein